MPKLVNIAPDGRAKHLVNLDAIAEIYERTVDNDALDYGGLDFEGCKVGDVVTRIIFCTAASTGDGDNLRVDALMSLAKIPIGEFLRRCREEMLVI